MENDESTERVSEENDGNAAPEVLGYHGPAKPKTPVQFTAKQIGCLAITGSLMLFVSSLLFFNSKGLSVTFWIFVGALAWSFYLERRAKRRKRSDVDEERYYAEREAKRVELQKAAYVRYAVSGPLGRWRIAAVEMRKMNMAPLVHEERIITFNLDGTGEYVWAKGLDSDIQAQSRFEFWTDGEMLRVRMTQPTTTEWCDVKWGIDVAPGTHELLLWLESTNPLPVEMRTSWPFIGRFNRAAARD